VRYERLVIEAGDNTFALHLHPRLTVIAGVGRLERESLAGELIGALGSSRPGVHLELVEDSGRRLAVFRPNGARHRVVDVNDAVDVSREFTADGGRIDLLAKAGLDLVSARHAMRLTAGELKSGSQGDQSVRGLAAVDQAMLWAAAERLRATEERLQEEAEAVGSAPEDAEVVERIERRHEELDQALTKHESVRHHAIFIAVACALAAIPAALLNRVTAFPFLAVAAVTTLISVVFRERLERARAAEQAALSDAGAQSYLGFHLQRVNGLLSSDQSRRRLMQAAEEHREAKAAWQALAGDVPAEWALEHQEEIVAAALLRKDADALGTMSSSAPRIGGQATADLAHVVVGRMSTLRSVGPAGESLPLVLDDPFTELERSMKPSLLELLSRSSGSPQVVFLTDDEDVASWARLEALTGDLAILEPTPEAEPRPHSVAV
jgi:hypothetical protein